MAHSTDQKPNWFRRFITPPAYADADQARAARLLHAVLFVMWTILILALAATLLIGGSSTMSLLVIGGVAIFQVVATYLNRHGQVHVASGIYIVFQWLSAAAAVVFLGGLSNPTTHLMLMPIIIGSLLLGVRGVVFASVLTLISTTLIFIVGQAGLLPPSPIEPTPVQYWINITLSVMMAAGLLVLAVNSIQAALTAARRSAAAQADSNRELTAIRASLEERVAARTAEAAQRSEELAHRSRQLEVLNQQLEVTSHNAERRAAQLAASAQVARAISQVHSLEELLTQVTRLIGSAFDFYHVGIFIVDEAGRYAVLHAANSAGGQAMLARGHRLAVGQQGMVGYVTQTGLPRIALDADAVHFDNPDLPDTRSEMTLPLQVGGRVLGALDLQTTQAAAFSDEDLLALSTLADQVAVAIVNARLFEQTRQAVDELNALNRRLTGEAWQSYVQTRAPDQVVWHSNDPALTPAPQAEADRLAAGEVTATPHASVPIMLRGQLIGALRFRAPADKWTGDARAIAASVASHLAQAIENTRLIEQTQRTAQREKQIAVAADSIHRATDLDNVLRAAIEEVSRIAGIEDVGIQLGAAQPDQPGLFASLPTGVES